MHGLRTVKKRKPGAPLLQSERQTKAVKVSTDIAPRTDLVWSQNFTRVCVRSTLHVTRVIYSEDPQRKKRRVNGNFKMSASTFHEPIQLYDEQIARLAPFPVLTGVRKRSSSLVNASFTASTGRRTPLGQLDSNLAGSQTTPSSYQSVFDEEENEVAMPGIFDKVLSRRTSLEAGHLVHRDTGGKLKITEKGRERRLSAGNWRVRSSVSSTSSSTGGGTGEIASDNAAPTNLQTPSKNKNRQQAIEFNHRFTCMRPDVRGYQSCHYSAVSMTFVNAVS